MKNSENKIFFAGRYPDNEILSGPEYFAKMLFDNLPAGSKSSFIQYFFDGRRYSFQEKLFSNAPNKPGKPIFTLGLLHIIKKYFKEKPDIIHIVNYERFPVLFYFLNFFVDVKIIYEVHGIVKHEILYYKNISLLLRMKDYFCEWVYFKFSTLLIFKSKYQIEIAKKYYSLDNKNYIIIPNSVYQIESKRNLNTGRKRISVYLSDISNKESKLFLNSIFTGFDDNAELFIINCDEFESDLIHLGLNIKYLKKMPVNEWLALLETTDIYLGLSPYETFSITAAEAMSSGCAVVVTKESGICEFIVDGMNGYSVHFGDAKSVKNILSNLINNDKLLNRISLNARDILNQLNKDKIISEYKKLYKTIE